MIPIRLEMHNFLAYRSPAPIAFQGLGLACLTGANGVGKSAILDAITWALWGKARGKRDDGLIHQGQRDMRVSLEFEQEGIRYRVERRRSLSGGSGRGALELLVWGGDARPRVISEDRMRQTQRKINGILRLDYETFVHSAFLQQGRADAFTLKTAAERKRILADLLGLDLWADYAERARQRLAELEREIDLLNHDLAAHEDEIARQPQLQRDMEAVLAEREQKQRALDGSVKRHSLAQSAAADLQHQLEKRLELAGRIDERGADIRAAQSEIERQDQQIAACRQIIDQADSIEQGYQQLQRARQSQSLIAESLARKQALDAQMHELESALNAQRAALQRESAVLTERIETLESQMAAASDADLETIERDVAELEALQRQRERTAKSIRSMKGDHAAQRTRQKALIAEGQALNERLDQLKSAQGGECPLCGQRLSAAHRDEVTARLRQERDARRQDYRDCSQRISQIDARSQAAERDMESWALRLKDLPALQQRQGALASQLSRARQAEAELGLQRTRRRTIQAQLQDKAYGGELRRQLKQLEGARSQLQVDAESQESNSARLQTLSEYDRRQRQLENARLNLPESQRLRGSASDQLKRLRGSVSADESKLAALDAQLESLREEAQGELDLRRAVDVARAELQGLNERRAILQQELAAIESVRESVIRLRERLDASQQERDLLRELRRAFGKDGVPAMVIETVLPELQAEANNLLSRMSDGSMTLAFSAQRERAGGGELIETLDIAIADELGTRDYDLFSGGEAFRINFAIRIALSKLLARRAGADLRALFIDEGFGSQDVAGRDKLVEAISAIQSDFDLILVVTHLDELRDAFPAHLLVEKTAQGSMVSLR